MKKYLYMMVGLPGSGKSTIAKHLVGHLGKRLSTDDFIENRAKELGKTYNEIFHETIEEATKAYDSQLKGISTSNCRVVVIDQTNVTEKSRKKKLKLFDSSFIKIAVVVKTDIGTVMARNIERKAFGRAIPDYVLSHMGKVYENPSVFEGFDLVVQINGESTENSEFIIDMLLNMRKP